MEKTNTLAPYLTVAQQYCAEITINKSRFFGRAFPVQNEEEALAYIAQARKDYYDATHNCYAYAIKDGAMRYSDDGEPGGTAGLPMMEVVKNKSVTNTLCIVTRYFGGILLGAGGLVRAYSRACTEAIDGAGLVLMKVGVCMRIECDYSMFNSLEGYLRANSVMETIEYLEKVYVCLTVEREQVDSFINAIIQKSCGSVVPTKVGEKYMPTSQNNE